MKISPPVYNVALNGLGRVGRSLLRLAVRRADFNVVAVNDLNDDAASLAYALNYDSTYGTLPEKFTGSDSALGISGRRIKILNEPDVAAVSWSSLGADIVIDASGVRANSLKLKAAADSHRLARAFITHFSADADLVLTLGCNEADYRASLHRTIASNTCDATAIAPVLTALGRVAPVEDVSLAILHPWLNHQNLLDGRPPEDAGCGFELGRAAWGNVIPKMTSAEPAIRAVLPSLKNLSALSYRIPTPIVACADVTVRFSGDVTRERVLEGLKRHQSESRFKILGFNREPLVSADFKGDEYSATLEERLLTVQGGLCKFAIWYDNEAGYAARVLDQVQFCESRA